MAGEAENQRKPQDAGSRSPASEEAKEQGLSGRAGVREATTGADGDQPPQGSGRSPGAANEQPREARKHFEPGAAPSEQGEKGHPSPEKIREHQQGIGRQSGSHRAGPDRSEEVAEQGEPDEDHTRHGRQTTPGHRPGHRTS